MKSYIIVSHSASNYEDFEEQVISYIKKGYIPLGGPYTYIKEVYVGGLEEFKSTPIVCQAMTYKEKKASF